MRIKGPDRAEMEATADEFEAMVDAGMREATRVASKDIKATSTPDDLNAIRRVWERHLAEVLVPFLEQVFMQAAETQRDRLIDHLVITAAAPIPLVQKMLAEDYLATASNRLRGVSDEVWEHARSEMLAGMQAGESIPQIRKRIQAATGFAKPRATMIARTEVIGATNRGSLAQMKTAEYPATKTWLATNDHRTRPTHRDANNNTAELTGTGGTDKFIVGGFPMDGPHDPSAPPGEVINCRCTLTYDIPDEEATRSLTGDWEEVDPKDFAAAIPDMITNPELAALIPDLFANSRAYMLDGRHSILFDQIADVLDDEKVGRLLGTAQQMIQDMTPATPVKIWVTDLTGGKHANALGLTEVGNTRIWLSDKLYRRKGTGALPKIYNEEGHWMPSANANNNIEYTFAHEFGHAMEPRDEARLSSTFMSQKSGLSIYGKTGFDEGYAEAFAEWWMTRGATKDRVALAYAQEYGWKLRS